MERVTATVRYYIPLRHMPKDFACNFEERVLAILRKHENGSFDRTSWVKSESHDYPQVEYLMGYEVDNENGIVKSLKIFRNELDAWCHEIGAYDTPKDDKCSVSAFILQVSMIIQ